MLDINKHAPNREKEINLRDVIDTLKVPEINKLVFLRIGKISSDIRWQRQIESYRRRVGEYFRELYESVYRRREQAGKDRYPVLYWFELSRFAESDWELTRMRPIPPPYEPYKELMSGQIIEKITSGFPVNPDKVVTLKTEPSGWLNRRVDLQFVRFSTNHLFGTVKENLDDWEGKFPGEPGMWETDIEMAHRVFFYYLHKFPSLAKEFIQFFIREMLPKLVKMEANKKVPLVFIPNAPLRLMGVLFRRLGRLSQDSTYNLKQILMDVYGREEDTDPPGHVESFLH